MRYMIFIGEQQLKRMFPERQRNLRFGLTRSKMQVIEVVRYRLVHRRQRSIDEEVVMPGISLLYASWRYSHANETKSNHGRPRHVGMVGWIDEIDLRILR